MSTSAALLETVEQDVNQHASASVTETVARNVSATRGLLATATVTETVSRSASALAGRFATATVAEVVSRSASASKGRFATVTVAEVVATSVAARRGRFATAAVAEVVSRTVVAYVGHLAITTTLEPAAHDWEIYLCDINGTPIINITQIASNRQIKFTHNRQTSVSFEVPSGDRRVSDFAADGDPLLAVGSRTVKVFRYEGSSYVIRANCTVETLEDSGDADNARTAVTAYSPFYDLGRRWARASGAGDPGNVVFTATDGSQIVKTLIDRTNTVAGNCGIETSGATYEDVDDFDVTYAYQPIATAVIDLADAFNGFDFYEEPLDLTTGKQVKLHCVARRGADRPDVFFGWGMWPHNIQTIRNFIDRSTLANYIVGLGSGSGIDLQHTTPQTDATSIAKYRQLEFADSMPDVGSVLIGALTQEEVGFRKDPRQIVTWVPQPGIAFGLEPFLAFDIGDTVRINVGSRLRGGFTGIQRIYGFTLALDDNGVERVSEMVTSPGGA